MEIRNSGQDGVNSIAKQGSVPLTGDVTLSAGTNVTLTQSGQNIQIDASGGVTGSGTSTQVAFWSSSSALSSSSNLFWDNSNNRLGINQSSPLQALHVVGNHYIADAATATKGYRFRTNGGALDFEAAGQSLFISNWSGVFTGTQQNYLILDASAQQAAAFGRWQFKDGNTGSNILFSIGGGASDGIIRVNESNTSFADLKVLGQTDSNTLYVDVSANSVGIGTSTPSAFLDIKAATTGNASLRIRSGTAPTSPNDGDFWFDATNLLFRSTTSQTVLTNTNTVTVTNKRITKRVLALSAGSATPAVNTDSYDVVHITAQSAAITSFTTNLTGTPVDGDTLRISITDDGTARALTWGASFEASTVALPTTTVISTRIDVGFMWNTETSKWRCVAVA